MTNKKDTALLLLNYWRVAPFAGLFSLGGGYSLIREDVNHWTACLGRDLGAPFIMQFSNIAMTCPEFRNLVVIRLSAHGTVVRALFRLFFPLFSSLTIYTKNIGHRLFIQHGNGSVIAAKSIGDDCWINQQVTIGFGFADDSPVIEDGARVCAGAKVIGDIVVGRNAIIGANGVAVKNVPAGEVWGGVPAQKIGENIHPLSPDSASI